MQIYNPSASFTRPADATQYAVGDLVANNTTAGSVTPLSWTLQSSNIIGPCSIYRARLAKSTTSVTSASFRLHLYAALPTVTSGDNGVFSSTQAANYVGSIPLDLTTIPGAKFSDGAAGHGSMAAGADANIRLPSGTTIYGLLEALATYTPGLSEVLTVTLDLIEHYPRGN
jgi:hypothetical protein